MVRCHRSTRASCPPAGRQIRSAFVPEKGCVFLASDYSQIELRVLAHLTEDENLVQALDATARDAPAAPPAGVWKPFLI